MSDKRSPYGTVKFKDIDHYHVAQTMEARIKLDELRSIIRKAAPKAVETISYNMPTFRQYRNLVYYAAHKAHIGFYPSSSPLVVFEDELKDYKTSKGAIQFPLDKPLPKKLIAAIVKHRLAEDAVLQKSRKA